MFTKRSVIRRQAQDIKRSARRSMSDHPAQMPAWPLPAGFRVFHEASMATSKTSARDPRRREAEARHKAGEGVMEIAEALKARPATVRRWLGETETKRDTRADILDRVLLAVERETVALAKRLAEDDALDPAILERAARTLNLLVRTLEKLETVKKEAMADDHDPSEADIAHLRADLEGRLARIRRARRA